MKKHFFALSAVMALVITNVCAQKGSDKLVSVGIRAGLNMNTLKGDDFLGNKLSNDFKTGFHAGVTADLLVAEGVYLQPALIYSTKGAIRKNNNVEYSQHLSYVELPVNVLFKPELGSGRLLLGAGPYAAFGLSGKSKAKSGDAAIELEAKFKGEINAGEYAAALLNTAYYVRPLDFGGNVLVGYELNSGFSLQLNGQLGLGEINPKVSGVPADKSHWKNLGFGASVGYRF